MSSEVSHLPTFAGIALLPLGYPLLHLFIVCKTSHSRGSRLNSGKGSASGLWSFSAMILFMSEIGRLVNNDLHAFEFGVKVL